QVLSPAGAPPRSVSPPVQFPKAGGVPIRRIMVPPFLLPFLRCAGIIPHIRLFPAYGRAASPASPFLRSLRRKSSILPPRNPWGCNRHSGVPPCTGRDASEQASRAQH